MSPYRIIVNDKTSIRLLLSMMSVDKLTKRHDIFIIERYLSNYQFEDIKIAAHNQTTPKNSKVLAKYDVCKDKFGLKYELYRQHELGKQPPFNTEYILSDCLITAMNDYIVHNNISIIQQV